MSSRWRIATWLIVIILAFTGMMWHTQVEALSVCWTAPTQNVDGSPLTDLDGYNIYHGPSSRNYNGVAVVPDAGATCADVAGLPAGTYFVAMTALDADGNESGLSNEVLKVETSTVPKAPVVLVADEVVFTVVKRPGRFVLLPIGAVPAGTVCDLNNFAPAGHGTVDNSDVVWTNQAPGAVRPDVVVVACPG
jgi:hypothetical protein